MKIDPKKSKGIPPVVVLGTMRSGSSLLTSYLQQLGLFIGDELYEFHTGDQAYEAVYFNDINRHLLNMSFGKPVWEESWYGNSVKRKLAGNYLRHFLEMPAVVSYMGQKFYADYGTPFKLPLPWGWKSPTIGYTLPLWLDLFPGMKLIHLYRNGAAFVHSARKIRAKSLPLKDWPDLHRYSKISDKIFQNRKITISPILLPRKEYSNLEWFSIWEQAMIASDYCVSMVNAKRRLAVKFERFVSEPYATLTEICNFIGVPANEKKIQRLCKLVRPETANEFMKDAESREFYDTVKKSAQMTKHGYDKI